MFLFSVNSLKIFFSIQGIRLFVKGRILYIHSGPLVFSLIPHLAEHQMILDYDFCRNPAFTNFLVAREGRGSHKLAGETVVLKLADQIILRHPYLHLWEGDTFSNSLKIKYCAVELAQLLLLYAADLIVFGIV